MSTVRLIPGVGDVVETEEVARLLPGVGDIVETETVAVPSLVIADGAHPHAADNVVLVVGNPQFLEPISDHSGSWLTDDGSADRYARVDESSPDHDDYIFATAHGQKQRMKIAVGSDPSESGGHKVRCYARSPSGEDLILRLFEGSTQIAEWTEENLPTTETLVERSLSGAEADTITDYGNLYVEVEVV